MNDVISMQFASKSLIKYYIATLVHDRKNSSCLIIPFALKLSLQKSQFLTTGGL